MKGRKKGSLPLEYKLQKGRGFLLLLTDIFSEPQA